MLGRATDRAFRQTDMRFWKSSLGSWPGLWREGAGVSLKGEVVGREGRRRVGALDLAYVRVR